MTFDYTSKVQLCETEKQLKQARDLLDRLRNGVEWWMNAYPASASPADEEILEEVRNFLQEFDDNLSGDDNNGL